MSNFRELPVVEDRRCTGCGDCVRVCPVDCLGLHWDLPYLEHPRRCISCDLCAELCPEGAIALTGRWCG